MEKIINKEQLERVLLRNWTLFLDKKKLLACVLSAARDQEFNMISTKEKLKNKNTTLKLSKFELEKNGFTIWAEFTIPQDNKILIGTSEFNLLASGDLRHIQTIGSLFSDSDNI